jgi:hypothetical protein
MLIIPCTAINQLQSASNEKTMIQYLEVGRRMFIDPVIGDRPVPVSNKRSRNLTRIYKRDQFYRLFTGTDRRRDLFFEQIELHRLHTLATMTPLTPGLSTSTTGCLRVLLLTTTMTRLVFHHRRLSARTMTYDAKVDHKGNQHQQRFALYRPKG